MNILFLGPQGSGKGTQAKLLAKKKDFYYFGTGTFLRELAKKDKKLDKLINKEGKLLEDEKVVILSKKHLSKSGFENVVYDGFPRSIKQYELMSIWLSEKGKKFDIAILLEIPEKESIRRLSARRISNSGEIYNLITNPPPSNKKNLKVRPDDRPEAIKKRLALYNKETKPLVKKLEKDGILVKIDGLQSIKKIQKIIERHVNRLK